jgi:hypothetical protein
VFLNVFFASPHPPICVLFYEQYVFAHFCRTF